MTILDELREKKISFSLTYFGKNDLDTSYTIKTLIDNYTYFMSLLGKRLDRINNMDDYIIWLINGKIINLKECIPLIIDENNRKLINKLIENIEEKRENLIGDSISFINNNISEILNYDNFDLHEATFNIIKKYQKGIKESTFELLIEKEGFYFLKNFSDFDNIFKTNIELLEKLIYNEKTFEIENFNTIVQIITICKVISNYQDERYIALSNKVIDDIYQNYLILTKNSSDENKIFELSSVGKALLSFFKKRKDSRANNVRNINEKLKNDISNYVVKHGVKFEQTIPVGKILENWISLASPISRMASLTQKSNGKSVKSILSIENIPTGLMDIFSSNIPTNGYYTLTRQNTIESIGSVGSATFIGILKSEKYYAIYFDDFLQLLSLITKRLNIDSDILEEARMLVLNTRMLIENVLKKEKSETIIQKTLYYNVEMLCCALIESLLREQYRVENEQVIYINYSNVTLGSLLNPNINNKGPFSRDHLLTLAFFLINSGENNDIGHNYRNNLAHLFNIYKDSLSLSSVCLLMYLLTDILTTIYIGTMKSKK